MSKKQEKIELYSGVIAKMGKKVNDDLLASAVNACGPSIYKRDAELVSSSDKTELDRVKQNFLQKRLASKLSEDKLDAEIQKVCDQFGSSNRNKYRAVFYYLLAENMGVKIP
ncbi:MAG: Unknown protein [uncultured Campylobacterales bacterium]|uniref:DUF2853 domain-containing protein n=1 Tax=uncultured Campylobacterales bacterium TaxID=352960 RepID=A0A6S6SGC1_9BACT|nr:MAG: Unknown protein [uncultured Campylobacterales bacterium]